MSLSITGGAATSRPGLLLLAVGVIFPAGVIGFELVTRFCAETFFDPLATGWHVVVVAAVPLINLGLWIRLRRGGSPSAWWLVAGGGATAVALLHVLAFLPLYPLSLIAILFYGMGLLPFAPAAAEIAALVLTAGMIARTGRGTFPRRVWVGVALGFVAVTALDLPAAATRLAVRWAAAEEPGQVQRGLDLVRWAGDRDLLLRLCYESNGRPSGLLSAIAMGWGWGPFGLFDAAEAPSSADARELYYRLTGDSFDAVPPPYRGGPWAFARDWEADTDVGGTEVGERRRGLALSQSRLDGSIDADDALAYVEWTLEIRNQSAMQSEARLTLALPPGAVVSRATLWIAGEEREAAFASRADARRAYERVVTRRRDPLLVTTMGADRVLVQVFPVMAGGSVRLRIGMTAPLALPAGDQATLALPAIVDRNFTIGGDLRHAVWIEGKGRLLSADPGLTIDSPRAATFRATGALTDAELARRRPRLVAARAVTAALAWAPTVSLPDGPEGGRTGIVQTIEPDATTPPAALMFVVDGSAKAAPARSGLIQALDLVPAGAIVGFAIADEAGVRFDPAPWTPARKAAIAKALRAARFRGGQDNAGALADAILALESHADAALIWISGPQPVRFRRDAGRLDQVLDRVTRRPALILYPVGPGRNAMLSDRPWFWTARSVAWSDDPAADLAALVGEQFSRTSHWRITRTEIPAGADMPHGSRHIARLWAATRALALAASGKAGVRDQAVALAAAYHLVTPVSGAVVLESQADYAANGLTPPDAAAVPTIPEPATWALLLLAVSFVAWLARSGRAIAARRA